MFEYMSICEAVNKTKNEKCNPQDPFFFALRLQLKNIKCKFQNFLMPPIPLLIIAPQLTKVAPLCETLV